MKQYMFEINCYFQLFTKRFENISIFDLWLTIKLSRTPSRSRSALWLTIKLSRTPSRYRSALWLTIKLSRTPSRYRSEFRFDSKPRAPGFDPGHGFEMVP